MKMIKLMQRAMTLWSLRESSGRRSSEALAEALAVDAAEGCCWVLLELCEVAYRRPAPAAWALGGWCLSRVAVRQVP